MLAATLMTYTGRVGSWAGRRCATCSGSGGVDGLSARRVGLAIGRRADPDLAGLDLLGSRDAQPQNAVLERGLSLVRLETRREADRPAELAPADLPDEVIALALLALLTALAVDRQRAVLDRQLDVVGLNAGQRRLDDERVGVHADVEREGRTTTISHGPARTRA